MPPCILILASLSSRPAGQQVICISAVSLSESHANSLFLARDEAISWNQSSPDRRLPFFLSPSFTQKSAAFVDGSQPRIALNCRRRPRGRDCRHLSKQTTAALEAIELGGSVVWRLASPPAGRVSIALIVMTLLRHPCRQPVS